MGNGLALGDWLIDLYKPLNKASVLRPGVVESGDHVCVAEIRLHSLVCARHLEVDHDAVYVVDYAVDQAVVPDLRLSHLNSERGNAVVDKGCLDGAWLTRIDLEGIGLEEFGEALDVGEAEVGVAP